jgi:hypothetical protein
MPERFFTCAVVMFNVDWRKDAFEGLVTPGPVDDERFIIEFRTLERPLRSV